MTDADVLVVGAGPAGVSTAVQLAGRGVGVCLVDRARFPRAKPCAECLSPQASRILADMGVLDTLEGRGALLRGMVVRSPAGVLARGDYDAAHGFRGFRDRGLAIRRELFDAALVDVARARGVVLRERLRVIDLLRDPAGPDGGRVSGVRAIDDSGRPVEIRARFVVGADGLRSVVARRLGLARAAPWPRRLALVAHYEDVRDVGEYVEMHIERDGFVGVADVGSGVTTVAAVFPMRRAREIARGRGAFLDEWLAAKPHLAHRFARARRREDAVAVGPFASHARRAGDAGALLVGDAADFFDPFTGEGIYAALRGGELAAHTIARALDAGSRDESRVLRAYDRTRRREFGGKWWVERFVGAGVAAPALANRAVRALAADKGLADLLVGVTGDFIPARQVLNAGYLGRLFLGRAPDAGSGASSDATTAGRRSAA